MKWLCRKIPTILNKTLPIQSQFFALNKSENCKDYYSKTYRKPEWRLFLPPYHMHADFNGVISLPPIHSALHEWVIMYHFFLSFSFRIWPLMIFSTQTQHYKQSDEFPLGSSHCLTWVLPGYLRVYRLNITIRLLLPLLYWGEMQDAWSIQ